MNNWILGLFLLLVIVPSSLSLGAFIGLAAAKFVWRSYRTSLWRVMTFRWKPEVGEKWAYVVDDPWSDMGHHAVIVELKGGWVLYDKPDCRWEKRDSLELDTFISLYKRA